ncbi:MAG: DUF1667 domain-containing protein [Oscillospiraceae bacterium]|nr:DUF1667 domain-containing protein [Oscillospiraceae bacterium]
MEKKITCIICPRGCAMTAQVAGETVAVTGNTCPKGEEYAINECLHPVRTVTATVRVANRPNTMVSVKTQTPVPKDQMMDVMALLRQIQVNAPVSIGDVVAENVCGSRVIITKEIA